MSTLSSYWMPSFARDPDCAICKTGGSTSPLWMLDGSSARGQVVEEIMGILRRSGSFSTTGVTGFWELFRDHLCPSCRLELDSIIEKKRTALALLEEAVRLDPKNNVAKQNLSALRQMA